MSAREESVAIESLIGRIRLDMRKRARLSPSADFESGVLAAEEIMRSTFAAWLAREPGPTPTDAIKCCPAWAGLNDRQTCVLWKGHSGKHVGWPDRVEWDGPDHYEEKL